MKKLILSFCLLIGGLMLMAQGPHSAIVSATAGTDSTKGTGSTNITLSAMLAQEYDYSYQIIPTAVGAGDSVNTAVALYQSNDYGGTSWTEITSARDTITGTGGLLIEGTDAKGIRHRLTLTGISTDTVKFKVYSVLKLDKQYDQ